MKLAVAVTSSSSRNFEIVKLTVAVETFVKLAVAVKQQ